MSISLANEDAEVKPVPVQTDIGIPVPELDTLTHILESFHDVWGNCDWTDEDKIKKQIQEIAEEVKKDERYQNAMQFSDIQNARDESERANGRQSFVICPVEWNFICLSGWYPESPESVLQGLVTGFDFQCNISEANNT